MTTNTSELVLHLPLDEMFLPPDKKQKLTVKNTFGKEYDVNETPKIVPDDRFGSCMSFNGENDYVELPSLKTLNLTDKSFTVCIWINGTEETKPYLGFWPINTTDKPALQANTWYHLAFCWDKDNNESTVFIDGQKYDTGEKIKYLFQGDTIKIGCLDSENYFSGKIAHVRIYNGALTPEEISAVMKDDQGTQAAFKLTYPIEFKLADHEVENVLYISDNSAQTFQVELKNSSDQGILIKTMPGVADSSNYNFALTFKPNTFEKPLSIGKDLPQGWVASVLEDQKTGRISACFLHTGPTSQKLEPGGKLTFTLEYGSAGKIGGARGTTVELQYRDIYYEKDINTTLNGTRIRNVDIINHRGKRDIPLYVGFRGPNTILNDGNAPNTLNIRIMNTLREGTLYFVNNELGEERNTKFIILFDNTGNDEWDLASVDQLNVVQVNAQDGNVIKQNGSQGDSPVFEITPTDYLGPCDYIDIKLSNIITDYPSGFANIYIKYENVPGYWDGQFVLPVEKTPIVQDVNKNVGIGVKPPEKNAPRLMVGGALKVAEATNIGGDLTVSGNVKFGETGLTYLRGNGSPNVGYFNFLDGNGWRIHFGFQKSPALTISDVGRVGINNPAPESALDVNGLIHARNGLKFGDDSTQSSALKIKSGQEDFENWAHPQTHPIEQEKKVEFGKLFKFNSPPTVMVSLKSLDVSKDSNLRIILTTKDISKENFTIHVKSPDLKNGKESKIYWVGVNWIAIGY